MLPLPSLVFGSGLLPVLSGMAWGRTMLVLAYGIVPPILALGCPFIRLDGRRGAAHQLALGCFPIVCLERGIGLAPSGLGEALCIAAYNTVRTFAQLVDYGTSQWNGAP